MKSPRLEEPGMTRSSCRPTEKRTLPSPNPKLGDVFIRFLVVLVLNRDEGIRRAPAAGARHRFLLVSPSGGASSGASIAGARSI